MYLEFLNNSYLLIYELYFGNLRKSSEFRCDTKTKIFYQSVTYNNEKFNLMFKYRKKYYSGIQNKDLQGIYHNNCN